MAGSVFGAGHDAAGALHPGVATCLQAYPAAVHRDGVSPDLAAVPQGAGKDAHRVASQGTQVERLVSGGLQLEADAFQPTPGDFKLLAGGQQRAAVGGLNQGVFADVDIGGDQHRVATARQDAALNRDAGCGHSGVPKAQPPGQRVGVAHAQGRGSEAGRIDIGPGTDCDAGLIHQHQVPVAGQSAKQLRRGVGEHPVDGGAGRAGLLKMGSVAGRNGKGLPVDGRVVQADAILRGDGQRVALGCQVGAAHNGGGTGGVSPSGGADHTPQGQRYAKGQRTHPRTSRHRPSQCGCAAHCGRTGLTTGSGHFRHGHRGA